MNSLSGPDGPDGSGAREGDRLESWKQIASYLKRGVSTVQRWEREEQLPVYRHNHSKLGSVYAFKSELDLWEAGRENRPSHPSAARRWVLVALTAFGAVALVALGAIVSIAGHREPGLPAHVIPLTSYEGVEYAPSLSPDGNQFVFGWRRHAEDSDLYVRDVAGGQPRKLTTCEGAAMCPKWAPDGREIAFIQYSLAGTELDTVPANGGTQRNVAKLANRGSLVELESESIAWSPSGCIAASDRDSDTEPFAIHVFCESTGKRQKLTVPPPTIRGDLQVAFSPDGSRVAFVRYTTGSEADIYFMPATGGQPERLTSDNCWIRGLEWTPDSKEIVFSSNRGGGGLGLWRLSAAGSRQAQPARLAGVEGGAVHPSLSRDSRHVRLAYQFETRDINIWKSQANKAAFPVIASTRTDRMPVLSPDGRRIAFASHQSGSPEIWVCNSDGSNSVQLTYMHGPHTDSPSWSYDGSTIAFTSHVEGNRDVYLIGAAGGPVRRLTAEPSEEGGPAWSHDGRWIYFRSDRSGTQELWKMPTAGGPAVRLTRSGAYEGFESTDGKLLYFAKARSRRGLWQVPVEGGKEEFVIDGVREGLWTIAGSSVYFIDVDQQQRRHDRVPVKRVRLDTREVTLWTVLHSAPFDIWSGFTASPDGHTLLWSQADRHESDLMLIEDFR